MRIGEVIGTVTMNLSHSTMSGATLRLVVPLTLANLLGESNERAEALVAYDELAAGDGSLVAFSEGREAAQPFDPAGKPVDAYVAAILDHVNVGRPKDWHTNPEKNTR